MYEYYHYPGRNQELLQQKQKMKNINAFKIYFLKIMHKNYNDKI